MQSVTEEEEIFSLLNVKKVNHLTHTDLLCMICNQLHGIDAVLWAYKNPS